MAALARPHSPTKTVTTKRDPPGDKRVHKAEGHASSCPSEFCMSLYSRAPCSALVPWP